MQLSDKAVLRLGLVGVIGVVFVITWACSAISGGDGERQVGSHSRADRACRELVREQLASPSSADFSGMRATYDGDGEWVVNGDVDAENGFGASLRKSVSCQVSFSDSENWTGTARVYE